MDIVCYWCSFLKGRMVAYQILRDVLKGYISYCSWCLFKFHFSILPIKVEYMFNLGWAGEVEVINYMMKCDNYKDLRFVRSKYWIHWLLIMVKMEVYHHTRHSKSFTVPINRSMLDLLIFCYMTSWFLGVCSYRKDTSRLVDSCNCFTCQNHTRAYLNHLLNVHEMLAQILLEM